MMRVALVATPWLSVPPHGYGGLEHVVHDLAVGLRQRDVHVELFATGDTSTTSDRLHALYPRGQHEHIARSLYDAASIPIAHLMFALHQIQSDGDYDIVHDHNSLIGPSIFSCASETPPILHTLHGPFAGAEERLYKQVALSDRVHFNAISRAQLRSAPAAIARRTVGVVHNAVNVHEYPFRSQKSGYFVTMARICRDKGQSTAAKLARRLNAPLRIAGIVNGITSPDELGRALTSGREDAPDLAYFRDEVLPYLQTGLVEFVGNAAGTMKLDLLSNARALLFPIYWDEPFGLAVIEALACGTPVIAMRRGAMPELIDHGVTGYLADDEDEFAMFMERISDIDPAACRRSVAVRFSAEKMAEDYLSCYEQVIGSPPTSAELQPKSGAMPSSGVP